MRNNTESAFSPTTQPTQTHCLLASDRDSQGLCHIVRMRTPVPSSRYLSASLPGLPQPDPPSYPALATPDPAAPPPPSAGAPQCQPHSHPTPGHLLDRWLQEQAQPSEGQPKQRPGHHPPDEVRACWDQSQGREEKQKFPGVATPSLPFSPPSP